MFYVTYDALGKSQKAGPYATRVLAEQHYADIRGYEGITNAKIVPQVKPWRTIVKRTVKQKEHSSSHGRTMRWWVSFTTTLTLSCGHKKVFGGDGGPTIKARCNECSDIPEEPKPEPKRAFERILESE
jgi:hypothetical protein